MSRKQSMLLLFVQKLAYSISGRLRIWVSVISLKIEFYLKVKERAKTVVLTVIGQAA
jgi:hypothetical protein